MNTRAPIIPPKNKAGEKVPPKKPKPIQQLVKINLKKSSVNKNVIVKFSVITLIKVCVPSPKTSSKKGNYSISNNGTKSNDILVSTN